MHCCSRVFVHRAMLMLVLNFLEQHEQIASMFGSGDRGCCSSATTT
jgi:hypothetical protein